MPDQQNTAMPSFRKPSSMEQFFNRTFGTLVGLGVCFRHNWLLQVRGRKSGRIYSTPVDLLDFRESRFLVAARGRTQWVRNAEVAGEVVLTKRQRHQRFNLRPLPDGEKPEILQAYLDRFRRTVQRYFPVTAGSESEQFVGLAASYPVFELIPPEGYENRA